MKTEKFKKLIEKPTSELTDEEKVLLLNEYKIIFKNYHYLLWHAEILTYHKDLNI